MRLPYEQGMHLASLHAAFGTLSALWERRASGCGQVVEVAQEVLAQIYYALVRYSYGKDILRRTGPQPAASERLLSLPGRPYLPLLFQAPSVGQAGRLDARSRPA